MNKGHAVGLGCSFVLTPSNVKSLWRSTTLPTGVVLAVKRAVFLIGAGSRLDARDQHATFEGPARHTARVRANILFRNIFGFLARCLGSEGVSAQCSSVAEGSTQNNASFLSRLLKNKESRGRVPKVAQIRYLPGATPTLRVQYACSLCTVYRDSTMMCVPVSRITPLHRVQLYCTIQYALY